MRLFILLKLEIRGKAQRECMRILTDGTGSTPPASDQDDSVHAYAQSVAWYGLLDLCHRDVVREAAGLVMMSM